METSLKGLPLVVIVGPTASGKTATAIRIAQQYNGEIICADSRTIYRGMDIGTAKPTTEEQKLVPHWGLDLVEPDERFSAADFKHYAERKIHEIRERGHLPLLVGGSGLYIDAVLFNYSFESVVLNQELRSRLNQMSLQELHKYCKKNNISLPDNDKNKRYVIRAIEKKGHTTKRQEAPISNSIIVGIATDRDSLTDRINQRAEQLFQNGVVEEAIKLGKKYGWTHEALTGNIYKVASMYLTKQLNQEEMIDKFKVLDRQLAKRQMTWFKRNPYIHWLTREYAEEYISAQLAKRSKA